MRVLMLSWEYPPNVVGGLGTHTAEIAPALARQGIELTVVTPMMCEAPEEEVFIGGRIVRVPVEGHGAYGSSFYTDTLNANGPIEEAAARIIEETGPFDLIHNHDWLTSFAAVALKNRYHIPLVATIHATERGRGRGNLWNDDAIAINDAEWRLTYEAWRVIACTHYMAKELGDFFGVPSNKVDVVPNGMRADHFADILAEDLTEFRARWAHPEEKLVLFVGRMVHEKGPYVLVDAVPEVLRAVPEAKFVMVGKGPELEYLRGVVAGRGLVDKVALPGFVDDGDRDRLYVAADVAVFPSLYEPFGIVALEAMAARTPVVVSEVAGLAEVVQHAETGITTLPGQPASCAWGIIHTLQHPEWAQMRVQNAVDALHTRFNWDIIARQTGEVYARVCAERHTITSW